MGVGTTGITIDANPKQAGSDLNVKLLDKKRKKLDFFFL